MSSLFLYGLGFVCLLVIALLIWDAYATKRHLREWAENWRPPGSNFSDGAMTPDGKGVLLKRFKMFKSRLLMAAAALILLWIIFGRHAASIHQDLATQLQSNDTESMTADETGGSSWSFIDTFESDDSAQLTVAAFWADSEGPDVCRWLLGSELPPNLEADSYSSVALTPNFDSPTDENGSDEADSGSQAASIDYSLNYELSETDEEQLNCALNGVLFSDSISARKISATLLMQ